MSTKIFTLLALVAVAAARTQWHQLEGYTFENYEAEFEKEYASAEERAMRQGLVEERLKKIRAHNADPTKTWKEGVNHLTDRTETEFKRLLGYDKRAGFARHVEVTEPVKPLSGFRAPSEVDWRKQGIVTPVKDQGQCGSCWSFATAETVESHYAKQSGKLAILSEQNVLDCVPNPEQCGGTGGCAGGTAELAYDWFAANKVTMKSEWKYPYVSWYGKDFSCRTDTGSEGVAITGYTKVPSNKYEPLIEAVSTVGPIAISVEAIHWSSYESGVFDGCNQTNPDIDHAVQLVGFGTDSKLGDYWLVRNSWTPNWGEDGYIRVKRTANEETRCGTDLTPADGDGCKNSTATQYVCGTCAILFDNCYPML